MIDIPELIDPTMAEKALGYVTLKEFCASQTYHTFLDGIIYLQPMEEKGFSFDLFVKNLNILENLTELDLSSLFVIITRCNEHSSLKQKEYKKNSFGKMSTILRDCQFLFWDSKKPFEGQEKEFELKVGKLSKINIKLFQSCIYKENLDIFAKKRRESGLILQLKVNPTVQRMKRIFEHQHKELKSQGGFNALWHKDE